MVTLRITGLRIDTHISKPGSRGGHIIGYRHGEPIYGKKTTIQSPKILGEVKSESSKVQNPWPRPKAAKDEVVRPQGHEVQNDTPDSWTRKGHLYRGMTEAEYNNTLGVRKPIKSRGDFSFESEGTNFGQDAGEAEDFANFGRDDPRKTNKPTYLVEINPKPEDGLTRHRDGTWKTQKPISLERVTRVWKMFGRDGAIIARQI